MFQHVDSGPQHVHGGPGYDCTQLLLEWWVASDKKKLRLQVKTVEELPETRNPGENSLEAFRTPQTGALSHKA